MVQPDDAAPAAWWFDRFPGEAFRRPWARGRPADGPPCPDLIRLLGDGPTGTGWQITHKRCTCRCDHEHDTCTVNFLDPPTGIAIHYSNGRWGRTANHAHHQQMAEVNDKAFG
ncbi:hypothetical protein [Streptomyces sp. NPDC020965]|uniref:hypothetical protein n=1 Tax=Streptomyces sp. NPDC020965 TaxID=3365105 RepID=UPI00379E34CD